MCSTSHHVLQYSCQVSVFTFNQQLLPWCAKCYVWNDVTNVLHHTSVHYCIITSISFISVTCLITVICVMTFNSIYERCKFLGVGYSDLPLCLHNVAYFHFNKLKGLLLLLVLWTLLVLSVLWASRVLYFSCLIQYYWLH